MSRTLRRVQFCLLWAYCVRYGGRAALFLLPLAAVSVAADQYRFGGEHSAALLAGAVVLCLLGCLTGAVRSLRGRLHAALALDMHADLKDRVSSAWEFLQADGLDAPRELQVADALQRVREVRVGHALRPSLPGGRVALPVLALALALSFWVPGRTTSVEAIVDPARPAQLSLLKELVEDWQQEDREEPEIQEMLRQLQEVAEQFDAGALGERDVMIALARMDEALRDKLSEPGVRGLAEEVSKLVPRLAASNATRAMSAALRAKDFDAASKAAEELSAQFAEGKLSEADRAAAAMQMSAAGAELGQEGANSFSGEFRRGGESMKSGDRQGFQSASRGMGQKFQRVGQHQRMESMRRGLGMCKLGMGQCRGGQQQGQGKGQGGQPGDGADKGGLKAGTGSDDTPLDGSRGIEDSYREMLQVAGMIGDGPVSSEVEAGEAATGAARTQAQGVHAEYAAVAEEAIESDAIPLSQRFHVKRYFQAIRPPE